MDVALVNGGAVNGARAPTGSPVASPELASDQLELVSIDMGYGHLRPAYALSEYLGNPPVLLADQPPLSTVEEQKLWQRARALYEGLSRAARVPFVGPFLSDVLHSITSIPSLYPLRDLSSRTPAVRLLEWMAQQGLGAGLAARLERSNATLLTTFFGPAVLSDLYGCERVFCVVTDSDINRIWAPINPRSSNIVYLAPSLRVRRRLKAYGVPGKRIEVTGYPLPHELVGPNAENLRQNLRRRLVTLDPKSRFLRETRNEISHFLGELPESSTRAPHLVFAVGGAGAQAELVEQFLPSLAHSIRRGKLRLTLVAGLRREVAERFHAVIARCELAPEFGSGQVKILLEPDHRAYFRSFNALLAQADILWTKPSELTFFAALGIPLLLSWPVGSHERFNRSWAISAGAAMKQGDPRHAGQWLAEMLKDGTLAGNAWSGYMRLPKFGLYRICDAVFGQDGSRIARAAPGATFQADAPGTRGNEVPRSGLGDAEFTGD